MTRRGGWIQTHTNRQFWPLDARPSEVFIEDIASALAHVNRYCGHAGGYSVAQHSALVAEQLPAPLKLWGLLHDASEAYLGDPLAPLRSDPAFAPINEAHRALQAVICDRFGLPHEEPAEVKAVDHRMLFTEKRDLRGQEPAPWIRPVAPYDFRIVPWPAEVARRVFLDTYERVRLLARAA